VAADVLMPRLSDSMEEGTVLKWLVEEGGQVKRGEPLVEIETDKANMTYEADSDGVLLEVLAKEGDTLPIGEPIARLGAEGEVAEAPARDAVEQAAPPAAVTAEVGGEPAQRTASDAPPTADTGPRSPAPAEDNGRIKASPVARRVAGRLGVELTRLEGTGPGGRILKADVEAAAGRPPAQRADVEAETVPAQQPAQELRAQEPAEAEPAATPRPPATAEPARAATESGVKGEVTVQELTRLQRTVSRRMAESKATVPDFSLEVDVDMTLCIELRDRLKEQVERAPSYNDMVVKAAALALREQPRVNGGYRDGRFELFSRVNVGVAVAARDALVVPVIPDADQKSLGEISRQARRLIERVRDGQVTPPELSGGTFTVSNLGMFGIERFTAIINTPQAAILTVGGLEKKPAVDERGRVRARDLMTLTLICDHRILYGADGARFLGRVRELLQRPLSLAL
jgi:pyruvate dehydrogenase E2 component (dihydrolipoamide acetyltransferase)